ncbi:MAG TPA: tannase/feruloyl esterase family alpha/beta hydrolase [Candidatus Acidoferrales bacterium]|nr:tannase/feruloyl esterase family alpha/beta hydrolase [Candidatus Acidoferrales bacterium]
MSHRRISLFLMITFTAVAVFATSSLAQRSCESLTALKLADTTIVSAAEVAAGPFSVPREGPLPPESLTVPAFCRVGGVIKPTADSDIKFEVWMPDHGWNGKFEGVGNGGFAGSINYRDLATALRAGFAATSTDTGHEVVGMPENANWALSHPEKIADFGYRAIHLTSVIAKIIVHDFYGSAPRQSYFSSGSNGGRQGLMEAQRFPSDYDGIIAGAPANFWTHLMVDAIWLAQALYANPVSYIPATKLPAIHDAVLAACDANDGVKDGIINDPRQCHFRAETLLCHGPETDACLTAPQVTALKKIYAGPTDSKGQQLFPRTVPGGELGPNSWRIWITGHPPTNKGVGFLFGTHFFSDVIFDNPTWDFRTFNFDADVQLTDKKMARVLNATDPKLTAFKARGGKLILYHGWADPAISPLNTVNYYNSVLATMGREQTESFVRLYMVPGMTHGPGGSGPDSFGALPEPNADPSHSMFSSLQQWVERGIAPHAIIATKYAQPPGAARVAEMTRPLCPYPQAAQYKGSGDIHDAANFVCKLEQ